MTKHHVSINELKNVLRYDPIEGNFYWLQDVAKNVKKNDCAGCTESNGYISIRYKGKGYKAHRLAWLLSYGIWPTSLIDHINGQRNDNRLSNLREATPSQNGQNRKPNKSNRTGFKGVSPHHGKFKADIKHSGKRWFLGLFDTAQEAANAYAETAQQFHTYNNVTKD